MWLCGLNQEKRALHVDEEVSIKVLLVDLAQRLHTHNTRVQNQNIDPSKRLESLVQEMLARFHRGDIGLDGDSSAAADVIDLVCDFLGSGLVGSVIDDDRRAVLG